MERNQSESGAKSPAMRSKWQRMWAATKNVLLGVSAFALLFLFFVLTSIEENNSKPKEAKTPSATVSAVQKEVDAFYKKEKVTEKEGEALYLKLRDAEKVVREKTKAKEEKVVLLTQLTSMKQDVHWKVE